MDINIFYADATSKLTYDVIGHLIKDENYAVIDPYNLTKLQGPALSREDFYFVEKRSAVDLYRFTSYDSTYNFHYVKGVQTLHKIVDLIEGFAKKYKGVFILLPSSPDLNNANSRKRHTDAMTALKAYKLRNALIVATTKEIPKTYDFPGVIINLTKTKVINDKAYNLTLGANGNYDKVKKELLHNTPSVRSDLIEHPDPKHAQRIAEEEYKEAMNMKIASCDYKLGRLYEEQNNFTKPVQKRIVVSIALAGVLATVGSLFIISPFVAFVPSFVAAISAQQYVWHQSRRYKASLARTSGKRAQNKYEIEKTKEELQNLLSMQQEGFSSSMILEGKETLSIEASKSASEASEKEEEKGNELFEDLRKTHDSIIESFHAYELDLFLGLAYPAMIDKTIPETQAFHRALSKANQIRKHSDRNAQVGGVYYEAVLDLELAFAAAENFAKKKGQFVFNEDERKKVKQAQDLINMAKNESSTTPERQLALRQALKTVEGVAFLPEEGIAQIQQSISLIEQ